MQAALKNYPPYKLPSKVAAQLLPTCSCCIHQTLLPQLHMHSTSLEVFGHTAVLQIETGVGIWQSFTGQSSKEMLRWRVGRLQQLSVQETSIDIQEEPSAVKNILYVALEQCNATKYHFWTQCAVVMACIQHVSAREHWFSGKTPICRSKCFRKGSQPKSRCLRAGDALLVDTGAIAVMYMHGATKSVLPHGHKNQLCN